MVKRVRNSKRVTLQDKYRIQKRVVQHHRKERRNAKKAAKNGITLNKKKNKDPGLPNLLPYKEKFLKEMKNQRQMEIDQQNLRQFSRRDQLMKERLENAEQRAETFEKEQQSKSESSSSTSVLKSLDKNKRSYLKEVVKLVDMVDIILLVLDARDPISSRAELVEQMVQNQPGKKLIYILNKIDLVPKQYVDKWLTYLRQFFPTVAFRASTQKQKRNLGRSSRDTISLAAGKDEGSDVEMDEDDIATASDTKHKDLKICVGGDTLLQLLKNYSRSGDMKNSITVGVVGYPNVGKSSLINSLKRAKSVGVSPTAGFTKSLQTVHLDSKVKLVDSPGVLFADKEDKTRASLVLRNCVNAADVEDPVRCVKELLESVDQDSLMVLYRIQRFSNADEFVRLVATKRGKLKKGGIPDVEAAARIVLQDLNVGKIKYYVEPPSN